MDVALNLSVMVEDAAWQPKITRLKNKIREAIDTALLSQHKLKLRHPAYEINIILTNDGEIAELNHNHRGKNTPTNVLSFPIDTAPAGPGLPVMLGDIVLAYGVIDREAKAEKKTFAAHTLHLIIHGALHLCGYDHETSGQARTMEGLERQILADLGIADPYKTYK